ncbi:hypothetical protein CVU82_00895 [Candidatus Falkowbacteria bacterium HGW-Falkowbacteria-1]|uniref:histidine kinase n=1 Tax=Candidatus Falkowbacteria bacterium HGW-Falkowbacteria-1 TaxID=2013768 RepID=A0A2N2EAN3_9BACT|nr:MAG: hypothetical protein CVU82_00895 [Candidatus Falkowbacteria bacterium HGW-Falkowbacteria-1]
MGIKKKLLISFLSIIVALLVAGAFFVVMNYIILSKYRTLNSNMVSEYQLIEDVSSLLLSFDKLIKAPNDTLEMDNFNSIYSKTKYSLSELKEKIVSYESKIIFNGLENNINGVFFDVEIGINSLSSGNYLEAIDRQGTAYRKNKFVKENVSSLLLKELEYSKNLQIEIDKVRLISQMIAILLLLSTVSGCVWYAIVFSNKLVLPLVNLTKLAKLIEGGDLEASVSKELLKGDDEVASLASSFHAMVVALRANIQKLQEYNIEIKNSRNHLKEEKQKLQQYLNVAGVIVLIFDLNNNVFLINKKGCEIFGIEASDIIGKNWVSEYVSKKNQRQTIKTLALLANSATPVDTLENIVVSKDKLEKNIVWRFSMLKNKDNMSQAILATGVDVTELTKAKITINQLKEVDALKNEVLNIATHELKTPLISIVGLSEVMKNQPKTIPSEYQDYISIIYKEGLKLTNLIKTMLTATRNEVSKMTVVKEKFNLIDLIFSLKTSLEMLAKRTDSHINFDLRAEGINIESDKSKISQVIYNFVDNAVKYGPKNQSVTIGLSLLGNELIRVEVKGEGRGISKLAQKSLFMKFSQLESSLSRSQDGMGLGLYICKQNVESLGGKVGVESEPNQGATFYFTLPLISKIKI